MQDLLLLLSFPLSLRALVLHGHGGIPLRGAALALLSATTAKPWAYPTRFISKSSQPPPLSVVSHDFHTNTPVEGKNPIKQEIQPPSHIPAQPSPPSISREGLSALHTGSMAQISRLQFPGALVDTYTIRLTCYIAKRCISSDGVII